MTRFAPARLLSGLALAALLTSCAGSGAGGDTTADGGAASAAEHSSGPAASTGSDSADAGSTDAATSSGTGPDGADNADGAGNPGGPGGDPGGSGSDVEAQGNPGAPGDVSVFEEAGVPFSALRNDAAGKCADGVCTLLEPVVGAGNPDDLGTVDDCIIQSQSDISYDPPAQDGFFQRGATVQATVDCTVQDSGTDGTDGTGDTSTTDGDGSDTSGDTGDQQPPADDSQG